MQARRLLCDAQRAGSRLPQYHNQGAAVMDRGDLQAGAFALHRPAGPARHGLLEGKAVALAIAAVALALLALYVQVLQHAVARGPLLADAARAAPSRPACDPRAGAQPSCSRPADVSRTAMR
jgi:hypothetical protein